MCTPSTELNSYCSTYRLVHSRYSYESVSLRYQGPLTWNSMDVSIKETNQHKVFKQKIETQFLKTYILNLSQTPIFEVELETFHNSVWQSNCTFFSNNKNDNNKCFQVAYTSPGFRFLLYSHISVHSLITYHNTDNSPLPSHFENKQSKSEIPGLSLYEVRLSFPSCN